MMRVIIPKIFGLFFLIILGNCSAWNRENQTKKNPVHLHYAIGADVSFAKMAQDSGVVFKDQGKAQPVLDILQNHGYNWIRLRLFHHPARLPNNLRYTIALAKQAKKKGFKFLLDYHYADSWADPHQQPTPAAWQRLTPQELADTVYAYTKRTTKAFRKAGVMPQMVQIGNEVRNGLLWPTGKLPEHWNNFVKLIKAGIAGVEAGCGDASPPLIMIHYDQGGSAQMTKKFYNKINSYGIYYDVIGLSYYPWWHGNQLDLRENLISLVHNFNKDVIVVETAYNWEPSEYKHQPAPFPETPEGQKEYLQSLNQLLLDIPSPKIKGLFWWEPAVPAGPIRSRGFFDDEGNVLPVINVFDKYTRGKTKEK